MGNAKGTLKARTEGVQFETLFEAHCNQQQVKWKREPLAGAFKGKRFVPIEQPLDYRITKRDIFGIARHGFVDCKSVPGKTFPWSQVKDHQVNALLIEEEWGSKAGYIVWFREVNAVVFFKASQLNELQYGQSLKPFDGEYLGTWDKICIGNLFLDIDSPAFKLK